MKYFIFIVILLMGFSAQAQVSIPSTSDHSHYFGKLNGPKADSVFIFDDGSYENGWGVNPNYTIWMGNYFPVSLSTPGVLTSFDLSFWGNTSGISQQMTIDVFDSTHVLIGSSGPFLGDSSGWISVPVDTLPFSGPFYAMVKWDSLPNPMHWLNYDQNGPYAAQDLERYYDGTNWTTLVIASGANPGVFSLRAHAIVNNQAGLDNLITEKQLHIYPNPAVNSVEVFSKEEIINLRLVNIVGEVVVNKRFCQQFKICIDVSALPGGIYCLSLKTKSGASEQRISVIH